MSLIKGDFDKFCEKLESFEGNPDDMYEVHYIDKSSGGQRKIEEPDMELKVLQKTILNDFLNSIRPHKNAFGFIKGKKKKEAALKHCGYHLVLRVDIEEFFHNTTTDMIDEKFRRYFSDRVIKQLEEKGLYNRLLDILTKDGRLAMGAPSSPATTNIVCKSLDAALTTLVEQAEEEGESKDIAGVEVPKNKYNYSRYADDMIFSTTDQNGESLIPSIRSLVESHGYELNEDKTLPMRENQRQTVLGMTVNEKPNIPRDKRRQFRARLHNLKMKLKNGAEPIDDETGKRLDASIIHEIAGHIAHAQSINESYAKDWEKELEKIKQLAEKRNVI